MSEMYAGQHICLRTNLTAYIPRLIDSEVEKSIAHQRRLLYAHSVIDIWGSGNYVLDKV